MAKIADMEGIGPKHAKKLVKFGIATTDRLLLVAAHKLGREDLAEQVNIPEKLILKWVKLADLIRIQGIGEGYCDLLEEAGVNSVEKLRRKNAKSLYQNLVEINQEKYLVRRLPSHKDVEKWIKGAKGLKSKVKV